jgi:hypothetical protein
MTKLLIAVALLTTCLASANAAPEQPRAADFRLEVSTITSYPDVKTSFPIANIRVRYVGGGEVKVSPISSGIPIFFGTPAGWQAKRKGSSPGLIGQAYLPNLKKGQSLIAVIPLASRFAQISPGVAKIPVRVEIQPFEGDWNILEQVKTPNKKSSLIALKPVTLTGYFTVEVLPHPTR